MLELWQELDDLGDITGVLRIIDGFIERITDESGDVNNEALKETQSTLNLMATHLSGLLKLEKRVFAKGHTIKEREAIVRMRDYYLLANNVDTLIGYRNLLVKMSKEEKLNNGFYWLLLNCLDLLFYKDLKESDFENSQDFSKVETIQKDLKKDINGLKKLIVSDRLTEKHLKWTLKMLRDDIK